MKIVKGREFLALPSNTLFARGKAFVFQEFGLKGETIDEYNFLAFYPAWVDAECSDEAFDRLYDMLEKGSSYPMDTAYGREPLYDDHDIFLIFEKDDIIKFQEKLTEALKVFK